MTARGGNRQPPTAKCAKVAKSAKNDERSGTRVPGEVSSLPCRAVSWRTWRFAGRERTEVPR